MEITSKDFSTDSKNGKATVNISESYEDGSRKSVHIREVENGYVVRIDHSYYEGEGDKKEYKYDEKEYISKDNPMEKKKEKKEEAMTTAGVASSISSFLGNMSNKISL